MPPLSQIADSVAPTFAHVGDAIAWTAYLLCAALAYWAIATAKKSRNEKAPWRKAARLSFSFTLAVASAAMGIFPSLLTVCCGTF
jgi:hypothetical protein